MRQETEHRRRLVSKDIRNSPLGTTRLACQHPVWVPSSMICCSWRTRRGSRLRAKFVSCVFTIMAISAGKFSFRPSRGPADHSDRAASGVARQNKAGTPGVHTARDCAMATRCCRPPESWAILEYAKFATPTRRGAPWPCPAFSSNAHSIADGGLCGGDALFRWTWYK